MKKKLSFDLKTGEVLSGRGQVLGTIKSSPNGHVFVAEVAEGCPLDSDMLSAIADRCINEDSAATLRHRNLAVRTPAYVKRMPGAGLNEQAM